MTRAFQIVLVMDYYVWNNQNICFPYVENTKTLEVSVSGAPNMALIKATLLPLLSITYIYLALLTFVDTNGKCFAFLWVDNSSIL
jgi:hypothetical protein